MFTYDLTTDIGQVRLLCQDTNGAMALLQDEELQAILDLEGGYIRYAAAQALEVIAGNTLLIEKKMKTLDVESDAAAVSAEYRALAKQLRASEDNMAAFDWAEQVTNPFTARERIFKQFLRTRF